VRRLFYVAVGAAAGIYVVRKVQKTAKAYSPEGLAGKAVGLGESLRYFADEVRAGMAEREIELRDALGLDGAADPAHGARRRMPPDEAAELIDHPTRHRRNTG
jgi:hypothetical protein